MSQVRAEAELFAAAGPQADRPARRRRRPRRFTLLAGAAALACSVSVGALVLGGGAASTTDRVIQATVLARAPGAHAEIRRSGARAELIVSGMPQPPLGQTYQVWLTKPGHAPQPTNALFSVDQTGNASIDVPGNLHGIERLMVTTEPLGGSRHPTTAAVIRATL